MILLLLSAGCADLRWSKEGADDATVARDLDACARTASVQARSQVVSSPVVTSQVMGVDPQGRPFVANPFPPDSDRFIVEHDIQRMCMTDKGYQLVPDTRR